ncbi:MAG: hypothetical protein MZV63_67950 [Marinilabiliales bacterium]|nr:hypothetical protein [Marinilabiliales bacterium]
MNSLGKMAKAKIIERHKDKLDYMYTAEGKNIINPENLAVLKQLLGHEYALYHQE